MEGGALISGNDERIWQRIGRAPALWLFLDYDGTLADFAATPEEILPDEALIALIKRLVAQKRIAVTIISGRRLAHIQALIPIPNLIIAGTYGLEIQNADGEIITPLDFKQVRPFMEQLKREWQPLLAGKMGFFLEDKGWTLAIHGKDAAEEDAGIVFSAAQERANTLLAGEEAALFRLQGGHRFLECSPKTADKKRTVEHILQTYPGPENALLVYLGDDDKDEIAFAAIQENEGLVIAVGDRLRDSSADGWLASPQMVRDWLQKTVSMFDS